MRSKNIVLIGFMGTGKTAVGKRLAERLGWKFIDTDGEVERITGKTISQIFNEHGETGFRSEERRVIQKLALSRRLVIATGGGAVLDPENIVGLKKNGVLICLNAKPEIIHSRVKSKSGRPLLDGDNDVINRIGELLIKRAAAYQTADFNVDTSCLNSDEVVNQIMDFLVTLGVMRK